MTKAPPMPTLPHAGVIAAEEEAVLALVVDGKGEVADEVLADFISEFQVGREDESGVGPGQLLEVWRKPVA